MTAWSRATIGSTCTVFSGGTPSKSNAAYWVGEIPWVSAKDLKADRIFDAELHISQQACDESAAKMAPTGSLLMLVRGMGLANGIQIGEVTSPVAFNQDLRAIVPPRSVDPRFLLLALRHQLADGAKGVLSSAAHGTLKIDADALRRVEFPVPPMEEQRRMVGILDEAFEAIAIAKANAKQNMQSGLDLFGHQLAMLFSSPQPSWEASVLGETYDVRDGTHDSPKYHDQGYPLITSKNLKPDGLSFDDVRMISSADYRKFSERSGVHKGDVLFAMIGTIGNPTVVEVEPDFAIKNVALFKVPAGQSSHFLRYYLSCPTVVAKMQAEAKGTTQRFVGLGYLRAFPILVPPGHEQVTLVRKLDELSAMVDRLGYVNAQRIDALVELQKSLLHRAFTGNLTAKWVEGPLRAVA